MRERQSCASMFMLMLRRAGLAERTVFISTPAAGREVLHFKFSVFFEENDTESPRSFLTPSSACFFA